MNFIYRLRLLGSVEIKEKDTTVQIFESRKGMALLTYLVRQKRPVSRNHLANLFWPDKSSTRGRRNLSRELSQLSTRFPNCFQTDYYSIKFNPNADLWVDIIAFEGLLKSSVALSFSSVDPGVIRIQQLSLPANTSTKSIVKSISDLTEAAALYQGEFMAGYYLDGCPEFEAWLVREREIWCQQIARILDILITYYRDIGDYDQARNIAARWLAIEPWQEEVQRQMMELLALSGQRSAALRQYEICCRTLAQELGVEPAAETVALYNKIKDWTEIGEADLNSPSRDFLLAETKIPEELETGAKHLSKLPQAETSTKKTRQQVELNSSRDQWLRPVKLGVMVVLLLIIVAVTLIINRQQGIWNQIMTVKIDEEQTEVSEGKTIAVQATAEAKQEAGQALSRQLATQAIFYLDKQLDLSLLLSLEANRLTNSTTAKNDLMMSLEVNPFLESYLHGHSGQVFGMAFSPDGQTLASVSGDNSIILWNMITRQPLGSPLVGHSDEVCALVFSPDGQTLATASIDGTIILWNISNLSDPRLIIKQSLTGSVDQIQSVALSPNGKILALGSTNGAITLWDITSRKMLGPPLTKHAGKVNYLAFSPDGKILASGGQDAKVVLWDVAAHEPFGPPLLGHTGGVTSIAFSPDGQRLASSSADKTIILWDITTHQAIGPRLIGPDGLVITIAFSPDGKTLASGGTDKTIILWDAITGKAKGLPLVGHAHSVTAMSFSPNGKTLLSGSVDGSIIIWNIDAAQFLTAHTAGVKWVAFSPDNKILASGDVNNTIILWDVTTGLPLGKPLIEHSELLSDLTFSPNGQILASSSTDGTIILWDVTTGEPLGPPLAGHNGGVIDIAFSPDSQVLASSSADHTVILWNVVAHKPLGQPLIGHTDWVWSVDFSSDGKTLASGSRDNTIILWDVATHEPIDLPPLTNHENWVTSVAFSPDDQTLVSGSADNTIILWNLETFEPRNSPLRGHTGWVWETMFSPVNKGQTLVSCGSDTKINLWDVATGQLIGPPLKGNTKIESIDLSPNGETLAVGGFENFVTLWNIDYEPWSRRACRIANRNLSQAEWEEFIGFDTPYQRTCPNLPPG